MSPATTGTFTISLDTELAWGTFDTKNGVNPYREAYLRGSEIVDRLCTLFEQHDVSATWAVVAHLFEDCDGHQDFPTVDFDWIDDWYRTLPCESDIHRKLWYAPEILDSIRTCSPKQDIGLHGYTHLIVGHPDCPRHAAERELAAAIAVLEDHGISPSSFVFPRNQIGHREVLHEAGIDVYRCRDDVWFEQWKLSRELRKPFRFANELLSWTPPVVTPRIHNGLVEVPGSQAFRPFHDGWEYTPDWTQVRRAKKGLDAAVRTGKIFHLRFHPFDLGFDPERLLNSLQQILSYADTLRDEGYLEIQSLSEIADSHVESS